MAEVTERSRWELAAESTVVKLRWFGIVMGYILVQTRTGLHDPWAVRAFLALGAGYAALDLAFWRMGEVILKGWPLLVSLHGIRLHRAAVLPRYRARQPIPLVLPALLDLLLDPQPAGGGLVDAGIPLPSAC